MKCHSFTLNTKSSELINFIIIIIIIVIIIIIIIIIILQKVTSWQASELINLIIVIIILLLLLLYWKKVTSWQVLITLFQGTMDGLLVEHITTYHYTHP